MLFLMISDYVNKTIIVPGNDVTAGYGVTELSDMHFVYLK